MIYETAKIVNENNIKHAFNLRLIKGTSETIYEHYHIKRL